MDRLNGILQKKVSLLKRMRNNMVTLAIGSDHRGFLCKQKLVTVASFSWIDVGTFDENVTDYPPFAKAVVDTIVSGKAEGGILLCGSGIGMSIAANRYKGIFAALVWNEAVVQAAKADDNANILVIPTDFVKPELAIAMVDLWQKTVFKGGRYQARLDLIDKL